MNGASIVQYFQVSMQIVALVALPPLIVAMVFGLLVAILQAATQVQDQTLPLTIKVIAVGLTLVILGPLLTRPLIEQSNRIFEDFSFLTR
jgi:type III secretion protein S